MKSSGICKTKTLIFVHGNSQNASVWKHQLNSAILQHFNLVTIDLPGHGKSSRMENYSIKEIIKNLAKEIDKEQNYVLIGHSLGGHFCIEALPLLKNCCGVLLCGTAPLKKPLNINEAFIPDELMALLFQENLNNNEVETLAEYISATDDLTAIKSAIKQSDGKFRSDMAIVANNGEFLDEVAVLSKEKLPVAFVQGEHDELINKSYLENLELDTLWKNKVNYIRHTSHSPHLESPRVFNELILEFVNSLQNS